MSIAVRQSIAAKGAAMPKRCSSCNSRDARPGIKTCQICVDRAVRSRARRDAAIREQRRVYAEQRNQGAREAGLCMICKAIKAEPGKSCCEDCAFRKTPEGKDLAKYVPADEWLAVPANQVARALRRFEWATPDDLALAMGVPSWGADRHARNNFTQTLLRLWRRGQALRRHTRDITGWVYEYRLAPGVQTEPPYDSAVIDDGYQVSA